MRKHPLIGKTIPCAVCDYAVETGIALYCKIKREVICSRSWIDPRKCWKYCECATCKFRSK